MSSVRVHDLDSTHSLASSHLSGLYDHQMFLQQKLPAILAKMSLEGGGVVSIPICANKVRSGPASTDQGHSTASKGNCHVNPKIRLHQMASLVVKS